MLNIAAAIGMISIFNSFVLLLISFLPLFKKNEPISVASLRLIAIVQSLGGLICILSAYMDFVVARYAFVIVGILLISASCFIAYSLRPIRAKRKSKPKNSIS